MYYILCEVPFCQWNLFKLFLNLKSKWEDLIQSQQFVD